MTTPVTLNDLQKITDETRMLVQAGLPIDGRFSDAATKHSNSAEAAALIDDLNAGMSVHDAIRKSGKRLPKAFVGAIAAGVRSNNVAAALEMVGDLAADISGMRRTVLQAAVYPLTVLGLVWILFCLAVREFLARISEVRDVFRVESSPLLRGVEWLESSFPIWIWIPPIVFVGLVVTWTISGRARSMAFRGPERALLLLPGIRPLVRDLNFYTLTRSLHLLVARELPLHEALQLAGACCPCPKLSLAAERAAAKLRTGAAIAAGEKVWRPGRLPPLLLECIRRNDAQADRFTMRLQSAAETYRRRVDYGLDLVSGLLPIVLFAVVAGGAVLIYALIVFAPFYEFMHQLGENA